MVAGMTDAATYIFDFDSTLVDFETLEALAHIALAGRSDAGAVQDEIARLTDLAMAGELPFAEALRRRLALLPLTRDHVRSLSEEAGRRLAPSVERNLSFFRAHAGR